MSAIHRAVDICGGPTKLSEVSGISLAAIHFWLAGDRTISPEFALKVETATGGKVTRGELRPDIWGPAPARAA